MWLVRTYLLFRTSFDPPFEEVFELFFHSDAHNRFTLLLTKKWPRHFIWYLFHFFSLKIYNVGLVGKPVCENNELRAQYYKTLRRLSRRLAQSSQWSWAPK
jgi:hypothetical protein